LITVAVWVLTCAVAAGTLLALLHLRATDKASLPPRVAGLAHGLVGATGLGFLLLALTGAARGIDAGVGSFGAISAGLFAGAILTGSLLLFRRNGIVMAIHAGIAITGYVLLLAWNSLG
jgi:hypothetical protein